jgi:hypothetical protein
MRNEFSIIGANAIGKVVEVRADVRQKNAHRNSYGGQQSA